MAERGTECAFQTQKRLQKSVSGHSSNPNNCNDRHKAAGLRCVALAAISKYFGSCPECEKVLKEFEYKSLGVAPSNFFFGQSHFKPTLPVRIT